MEQRGLSGIYFRARLPDGSWGNLCFEELTEADKLAMMDDRTDEWIESLHTKLVEAILRVGYLIISVSGADVEGKPIEYIKHLSIQEKKDKCIKAANVLIDLGNIFDVMTGDPHEEE